jgi:hypothetical protein
MGEFVYRDPPPFATGTRVTIALATSFSFPA